MHVTHMIGLKSILLSLIVETEHHRVRRLVAKTFKDVDRHLYANEISNDMSPELVVKVLRNVSTELQHIMKIVPTAPRVRSKIKKIQHDISLSCREIKATAENPANEIPNTEAAG